MALRSLVWDGTSLILLDQTKLPGEIVQIQCRDYQAVAAAIREMRVRGAPAIGAAAAFGLALAAREAEDRGENPHTFVPAAAATLRAARPTAVNLAWALERLLHRLGTAGPAESSAVLAAEAEAIVAEDLRTNEAIGRYGQELLADGDAVLTHCNAGALATTGYGTALGVIRAAIEKGKRVEVYADETRPFLQGARLTAFELMQENIPVTLICDDMAAALLQRRRIAAILVGADRIAKNGDTANKIGTYGLAVLARYHHVPFYVAAPMSTYDPSTQTGAEIPIEERPADEVRKVGEVPISPAEVQVWNPAFDVTPADLITGIITEYGIVRGDLAGQLAAWQKNNPSRRSR